MTSAYLSVAALAGALPTSGGEGNILLPHHYDLVWGTVAFLLIAAVLMYFALPRFTAVLDERTKRIEEGLALAAKAQEDEKNAELKATRLIEDARRDAAAIRTQAQEEARAIIAAARQEAAGEAGRALESAQRQIRADKQAAQVALRKDVGGLATTLAERILGEQLRDAQAASAVIDRFLDSLEAQGEPSSTPVTLGEAR